MKASKMVIANALLLSYLELCCDASQLRGLSTQRVPLRWNDPSSPYCLAIANPMEIMGRTGTNFLATQCWPSARCASQAIEASINLDWSVVEFGCGPGLPSITAAKCGCKRVVATDLSSLALELVAQAALQQNLQDIVSTQTFDLLNVKDIPSADLYILSDVFESDDVSRGAACVCFKVLQRGSRVWVFAQQDRAQRDAFLNEMQLLLRNPSLKWQSGTRIPNDTQLWLGDLDEVTVGYG